MTAREAMSAELELTTEPKKKLYTHMGSTHEVSYPHKSDTEIGHMVRMLMRSDLNHEAVVCAARDRILYLVARNEALAEALRTAAQPAPAPVVGREAVIHAICPHIKQWVDIDPDLPVICLKCPASIQTSEGEATNACRLIAERAADAILALFAAPSQTSNVRGGTE